MSKNVSHWDLSPSHDMSLSQPACSTEGISLRGRSAGGRGLRGDCTWGNCPRGGGSVARTSAGACVQPQV